jgi:putative SOS response-associated peptidase YedK
MCGRFTLVAAPETIAAAFQVEVPLDLAPRYNIAPGQPIAVVCGTAPRRFLQMHWGLIPAWQQRPAGGLINARSETAHEKPAFRAALQHRRCLVPADGFYEWQPDPHGKQPWYFAARDGRPLAFAAIFEAAHADRPASVALLTTAANPLLQPIHDRMPLILPPDLYQAWLEPATAAPELIAALSEWPADAMTAVRVSRAVNRVANDGPQLITPAETWQAQSFQQLW